MATAPNAPRDQETGKSRSVRIPLDYYKKADVFTKWKTGLSALALAGVAGWLALANRPGLLANHGTLSRVHATWDADCERCHVPFRPIDGTSWTAALVSDRSSDAKCQACHKGLPDHHAKVREGDAAACASCHREHRGRDAQLNDVADLHCVRCHGALKDHVRPGSDASSYVNAVTGFGDPASHPEFALFRGAGPDGPKDPGRLKFSHARHLARGFALDPSGKPDPNGKSLMTRSMLPGEFRDRYATEADGETLKIDCADCHRPDGDRTLATARQGTRPGAPARGGAYMTPVRYESECRACHPLVYDPKLPTLIHGLQPEKVNQQLWQAYSAQALQLDDAGREAARKAAERPAPVPGRGRGATLGSAGGDPSAEVASKVERAQKTLLQGKLCLECHSYADAKGTILQTVTAFDPKSPFLVARPEVPEVWYRHARFDHAAHKAVADCKSCHPRAYLDAPSPSKAHTDVLIPASDVCRTCHAPARTEAGKAAGGAGYGCTECHGYHNGDHASPSPAPAPKRDVATEADLRHFLARLPQR